MKKLLLVLMMSILSFSSFSKTKKRRKSKQPRFYKAAKYQYKKRQYNLALYYLMTHLKKKKPTEKELELVDKIVQKTGTLPLYLYDVSFIDKLRTPSTSIHLAHHHFKGKNYKESFRYASLIKNEHHYYAEAQLLMASSMDLINDKSYIIYVDQCQKFADKEASKIKDERFKRYFVLIKEQCIAVKARRLFKDGKYSESNDVYDEIQKKSYSWPYVLLEKAWNYYRQKDYNRTLGITMTYQSPLLKSYFFPEAEVLKAISYYELCLYRDSAFLIDKFFKVYKERSKTLISFIKGEVNDKFYFNLVSKKKSELKQHPYILNLRNQLKKKLRVNLHLSSYKKAVNELEKLKSSSSKKKRVNEIKFLKFTIRKMEKIINKHVKEYFYFFINQINYFSYEMFNLKLEILTRKKDLIYDNKNLISTRARGDYSNVQRDPDEMFFHFNGAFWADELGDYSFGLKSNCKAYSKGK